MIFHKVAKTIHWGKDSLLGKVGIHLQNNVVGLLAYTIYIVAQRTKHMS